jgi:hypothetical protein
VFNFRRGVQLTKNFPLRSPKKHRSRRRRMELSTEDKEQFKAVSKSELIQVSEVERDISPGFKHGMRVPARIIATWKLIDAMDLRSMIISL